MKLSHTGCKNGACLFRWHILSMGHVEQSSDPALGGKIFHEWAHDYVQHLIEVGRPTDFSFMQEMVDSRCVALENPWLERDLKYLVKRFLNVYIHESDIKHYSELKLAVDWDRNPIPFREERGYRGIIDKLEIHGTYARVRDWKTGHVVQGYGESEHDPQLLGYAILVFAKFPQVTKCCMSLEYIRQGYNEPSTIRREDTEKAWEAILRTKTRIEQADAKNEYPAKRCDQCKFCTLKCPLTKVKPIVTAPQTPQEAEQMASRVIGLTQEIKAHHEALSVYTEQFGELEYSGYIFGWAQTMNDVYGKQEVFDRLQELGMTHFGDQCFDSLTKVMLRNLVDKHDELQTEEVNASADVKAGKPKFGMRIKRGSS